MLHQRIGNRGIGDPAAVAGGAQQAARLQEPQVLGCLWLRKMRCGGNFGHTRSANFTDMCQCRQAPLICQNPARTPHRWFQVHV